MLVHEGYDGVYDYLRKDDRVKLYAHRGMLGMMC